MLAEQLNEAWEACRESVPIDPVMRFSSEGLVLGAGTILAESRRRGREVSMDPSEPRLQALLAAAHLSRPAARDLAHLRTAAEFWNQGDSALAAMHLSLSGVDRLEWPEADARRLFLADGLLKAGIEPNVMIHTIEAGDPSFDRRRPNGLASVYARQLAERDCGDGPVHAERNQPANDNVPAC